MSSYHLKESINSSSIFVGDINNNGEKEVAFPGDNGISFYELGSGDNISETYNLFGYSSDSATIKLTWEGSSPEYFIYRGMNKNRLSLVDSTTNHNFTDTNLVPGSYYYYKVNSSGSGPASGAGKIKRIFTHNPARLLSVTASSPKTLDLTFSDRIDNTIGNINAFEIIPEIYPNTAAASSQYSYQLSFKDRLPSGRGMITVKGLKDYYDSPVKQDTISFSYSPKENNDNFYIKDHSVPDPYTIRIVMSLNADPVSAEDTSNYSFSPANYLQRADIDPQDNRIIYLYLEHKRPVGSAGKAYTLTVKNLRSSEASGSLEIGSGAGSVIKLFNSAENLSNVYVYPSPARLHGGVNKITFANLPTRVKITIFSLTGRKIKQLEGETSGGGLDYDLKDESGELLQSGIYIYRIVQLDGNNNETGETLGKFAVIK